MTDTLPPDFSDDDVHANMHADALTRRIITAAQAQDGAIAVPAFDAARENLTQRLAEREHSHAESRLRTRDGVRQRFELSPSFGGRFSFHDRSLRYTLAVAVAVLVAVVLGVSHLPRAIHPKTLGRQYVTRTGQQATFTLSDGSRVRLAPQSTFRVESGFGGTSRIVSLSGEAYFDVPSTARTPFIVRTGTTVTRVLGTTFNVRRYAGEKITHIAVLSGKVTVAGANRRSAITLASGMTGVAGDSAAVVDTAGVAEPFAWTNGRLVFHKAPPSEVLQALTRWYGYEFRIADSAIVRRTITLGLSTESSVTALATLKQVLDVELTFDGNLITLHPRRGARSPVPLRHNRQLNTDTFLHSEVGR